MQNQLENSLHHLGIDGTQCKSSNGESCNSNN